MAHGKVLALTLLVALTAACGGGGGGSTGGTSSTATAGGGTTTATGTGTTPAPAVPDTTAPTFAADAASGPNTFHSGAGTVGGVTLRGTADDAESGIASVTVNGGFAVLGGSAQQSTWSAQVVLRNGVNVVEVEAKDAAGNATKRWWTVFYADRFLPATADVASAGIVYVTDAGFAHFSTMVTTYLQQNPQLLNALVGQSLALPVLGLNVTITNPSFNPPVVVLAPTATGLLATVTIDNVNLGNSAGLPITASRIVVAANLSVTVANGVYAVAFVPAGTTPALTVTATNLVVSGIQLPSSVIGPIMASAIQQALPGPLTTALNSLTPSYTQTVLGTAFTASATPSAILYSTQGIEIHVDGNVTSAKTGTSTAPGSLGATAAGTPAFPQTHHVHGAVNVDAVNRALFAAWESGILTYTIDQSTLAQLGVNLPFRIDGRWLALFFPQINAYITNPQNPVPVGIQVSLALPPSMGFEPQTPNLRAAFGGLSMGVVMDFGAGWQPILALEVAAEVAANVTTTATTNGSALDITLVQPTTIRFEIAAAGNPLNLPTASVNSFMNLGISQAITLLGGMIPQVPVNGVPAFGSFPGAQFQSFEAGVVSRQFFAAKATLR